MKGNRYTSELLTHAKQPSELAVTILLAGGKEYTVNADNLLLQELCETMMREARPKQLFQIPIDNGNAMLTFASDRLVGLITKPPLKIAQHTPQQRDRHIVASDYFQIKNFLSPAENQRLLEYVVQREADFVPTSTSTQADNYRKSLVLHNFPEFVQLITQKVAAYTPKILKIFGVEPFPISKIEAQLTAHNDQHFYKVHNDNGSPNTASRELTYVYYFHRQPKPYTGGELVIYDSEVRNNRYIKANTFKVVEPENNTVVFFLSRYMHEVRPIQCPSQAFIDSRFTINGWVRR
ncbi:Prolyl 4-hydroxylase alpha subunit (plasmid) [Gloeocapsa sp. PCC 7428]|uniref:2OG-Fe(II) oxygenase n=1 Tax=Gloeocapsa sp. PCC 7428 TaxID=1173026 RepID=UPI0002A5E9DF|nr:2OG-Fe(II) oxygenase [Gloeocapsa sp. PCC 7428]AFZ33417.1 Prolyl 4-hydroxylase alpha subunit [Gloeocapsa sp. PCC 7428]